MMVCSKAARKEPAGGRVGGPSFTCSTRQMWGVRARPRRLHERPQRVESGQLAVQAAGRRVRVTATCMPSVTGITSQSVGCAIAPVEDLFAKQAGRPVTPPVGLDQPVVSQHRNAGVPMAATRLLTEDRR
jgi:hypothetical protein